MIPHNEDCVYWGIPKIVHLEETVTAVNEPENRNIIAQQSSFTKTDHRFSK
jgi:hypothetical protein